VRIKKDILSLVFQVRLILTFSFGYKASLEISRSMVGGGGRGEIKKVIQREIIKKKKEIIKKS